MNTGPTFRTPQQALDALIASLHASGRPRVWSLVITLFGDAIVPRGGRAPLTLIQDVMARLGVEAGAVRTAMSRLAADHWVIREKDGRNSYYRLADEGRHAFDLATRRIYAAGPPDWDGTWTVVVAAPGTVVSAQRAAALRIVGFGSAGNGTWLRPETASAGNGVALGSDVLVVHGAAKLLPGDVSTFWAMESLGLAYLELSATLSPLVRLLERSGPLASLDALAARVFACHHWRRIVLRDPALPAELLPADWPGDNARDLMRELYRHLGGPSEAWLDAAGLPVAADIARFERRFGGLQSSR